MDQEARDKIAAHTEQAVREGLLCADQYPPGRKVVDRIVKGELNHDQFHWIGEGVVYEVEGEWPVLYLTPPELNPILAEPVRAAVCLAEHGLLPLTDAGQLCAIKRHPSTVRILLVELDLRVGGGCCWPTVPNSERRPPKSSRRDAKHPHFHIESDGGGSALNPAQRELAEALFGKPLDRYLSWLRDRDVFQTKIMALWQGGVVAYHQKHGPFAMGARLSEVQGHWEVDGNMLLSCDGLLSRSW